MTYVLSRHRQIELAEDPEATETIPPLTKSHFIKPPNAVRDWVSKLIGKWFLQELSKFALRPCEISSDCFQTSTITASVFYG